jgi:hypothetical protein
MRKIIFATVLVVASFIGANAQSGNNQLGIGAELGIGTQKGSKASYGGSLKYLHGVGTAGHVTLSAGLLASSDKETILGTEYKAKGTIIPIMLGYRHSFSGFYAEPQLGYVRSKVKTEGGGSDFSASDGSFGYAIGIGYAMEQGLDIGARFLNTTESGSKGLIVFRLGYNFTLGGASASK